MWVTSIKFGWESDDFRFLKAGEVQLVVAVTLLSKTLPQVP